MHKFKVGEIIKGVDYSGYYYTGPGSVCEVVRLLDCGRIRVRVIKPSPAKYDPDAGSEFVVHSNYFSAPGDEEISQEAIGQSTDELIEENESLLDQIEKIEKRLKRKREFYRQNAEEIKRRVAPALQ